MLKIAQRARDMAADSLGTQHAAYAVSLQNLGLYYDAIENDAAKTQEFFAYARAVLNDHDLPLADGFYWLGIFHLRVSCDAKRAEGALTEALAIQHYMSLAGYLRYWTHQQTSQWLTHQEAERIVRE